MHELKSPRKIKLPYLDYSESILLEREFESSVNDTTEKSEQRSNRNTQSQEKLGKSTKESTLQKPTGRSARKVTAGARDKTLGYNLQEELN